jgi:hypothetical protein
VVCIRLVLARDQWLTVLKTVLDFWFLYETDNWLSNWVTLGVSRSTLFYPTAIRDGYQLTMLSITTVRISHLTRTLFIVWFVFKRHPQNCEELLQSLNFYLVLEVNIIPCVQCWLGFITETLRIISSLESLKKEVWSRAALSVCYRTKSWKTEVRFPTMAETFANATRPALNNTRSPTGPWESFLGAQQLTREAEFAYILVAFEKYY